MLWAGSTSLASLPELPVNVPDRAARPEGIGAAPATGSLRARCALPFVVPPAEPWPAVPEHAATKRPAPIDAEPAMRSVRSGRCPAPAPKARYEPVMHLGRNRKPGGFG